MGPPMRIEQVEAINLLHRYPERHRFQYGGGMCDARVTTLILVHTECGAVGVGSVYSYPAQAFASTRRMRSQKPSALVYLIVREQLAPMWSAPCPTA